MQTVLFDVKCDLVFLFSLSLSHTHTPEILDFQKSLTSLSPCHTFKSQSKGSTLRHWVGRPRLELIPGEGKDEKLSVVTICFLLPQYLDTFWAKESRYWMIWFDERLHRGKSQKENIGNLLKDKLPNFVKDQCSFRVFPGGSVGKESACYARDCLQCRRPEFNPWRRKWQTTPISIPWKSHGQKSLVGCSPWGCKSQTQLSN